ncbi:tRNA pseudouridine(55) synthase TruB [Enterobacteriaceae endosymbiont of Neohaemonia nigricornis]|uniref:tRNA pseudouridine(55) synthase TruB n=1 Tax=Enterobacteriaceae endosymbiont of Neohaemonia nigricornis TaxID=2675792 RepID=UPI001448F8DF|nr:tRNA pseudouridine(55) synthase TruB [Enterobacteriaceae endosymbiont of Neohaemonia nigricornis]QJC30496.1 tRNA pseudouridine(55) synthase TruB [Enterobacteriaceae endosymbiont of Neohaemonia nigricornis]
MNIIKHKQNYNGLLLIDKTIGLTSNKILQNIKSLCHIKKAGYTGTLDPLASGLLPICCGKYTKLAGLLSNADKTYTVTAYLGIKTDTADIYGKIIKKNKVINITIDTINKYLKKFTGYITQKPNMYSAIKYHGIPLYKYARSGITIKIKPRIIIIYNITLISFKDNKLILNIHCSKGTYIRSLIDDLGDKLKCGAHVTQLRRLTVAHISVLHNKVLTLEELYKLVKKYSYNILLINKLLLPIQYIVQHIPKIYLSNNIICKIKNGYKYKIKQDLLLTNNFIRIYEINTNQLISIGSINKDKYITKCSIIK